MYALFKSQNTDQYYCVAVAKYKRMSIAMDKFATTAIDELGATEVRELLVDMFPPFQLIES